MVSPGDARKVIDLLERVDAEMRSDLLKLSPSDLCDLAWELDTNSSGKEHATERTIKTPFKNANKVARAVSGIGEAIATEEVYSRQLTGKESRQSTLWQRFSNAAYVIATLGAALSIVRAGWGWLLELSHQPSQVISTAGSQTEASTITRPRSSTPNPTQHTSEQATIDANQNMAFETDARSVETIDNIIIAQIATNQAQVDTLLNTIASSTSEHVSTNSALTTPLNKAGLKALKEKNYGKAAACFAQAASADPANPKFLSNLGFAQTSLGNLDSAKKNMYSSLALGPKRSVAWGDMGLIFAKEHDTEKAAACLLIGLKVSDGKTLTFIQELAKDDVPEFREAGQAALAKLQETSTYK